MGIGQGIGIGDMDHWMVVQLLQSASRPLGVAPIRPWLFGDD